MATVSMDVVWRGVPFVARPVTVDFLGTLDIVYRATPFVEGVATVGGGPPPTSQQNYLSLLGVG